MENLSKAATENGAENQVDDGAERPKTARELMMEQIDERHDQHQAEQVKEQGAAAAAATEGETVLVDDLKRFKVRVKIGDREEERSLDSVMNELQSSQGRLRSSSQSEKELRAALAEKDRLLEEQLAAQMAGTETTDDEIGGRVSEAMAALIEGDEAKATAALLDVIKKGRPAATPLDETQLVDKVKNRLAAEDAVAQQAAVWEAFVSEHPEFREQVDPVTGAVSLSEERQYGDYLFERDFLPKIQAGEISYQEALKQTAEAAGKVFAKSATPTPPEKKDAFTERSERKRQLDQLPVAAGARNVAASEGAGESQADIIREMRKARGLPV